MPGFVGRVGGVPAYAGPNANTIPSTQKFGVALGATTTSVIGVTVDQNGNPLAGCTVELFRTGGNQPIAGTVSDGSGNYRFDQPGSGPFFLVMYLPGSPDMAGTSINTIVAT
jgi:Carboxypeptidase regulatory-like domain